MKIVTVLLATSALLALLSAATGCATRVSPAQIVHGNPVERAPAEGVLAARRWKDETGADVAISDYRGAPFVVTEIYTSCQVRCPMTLDALRSMDRALRDHGVHASFVLVTLDPQTDTPERLSRFKVARDLPENFHLLTGTLDGARQLARYLNVNAAYDSGHIDHDVQIALFDAKGQETRKYRGWTFDEEDLIRGAR